MSNQDFITVIQAEKLTGWSRTTLRRAYGDNTISHKKKGNVVYLDKQEVIQKLGMNTQAQGDDSKKDNQVATQDNQVIENLKEQITHLRSQNTQLLDQNTQLINQNGRSLDQNTKLINQSQVLIGQAQQVALLGSAKKKSWWKGLFG